MIPDYEALIAALTDNRVLSLEGLERAKRAAGRLTDIADLAEILEIRKRLDDGSR